MRLVWAQYALDERDTIFSYIERENPSGSDGEFVRADYLVLHDPGHDIRTPTRELTIARDDVLKTRRRIGSQPSAWR